jgi:hypothetical protein
MSRRFPMPLNYQWFTYIDSAIIATYSMSNKNCLLAFNARGWHMKVSKKYG